jgi:hypothetical protein
LVFLDRYFLVIFTQQLLERLLGIWHYFVFCCKIAYAGKVINQVYKKKELLNEYVSQYEN